MIRLHEFITKIRNCKTIAEERAEYQKEMAAIRESFSKSEETLRPRNVTKLLFINMSGQETNFGQMECLKLITANSLIEKRIGYLGLTQLFHEKSELLMMATNRLRVDLNCMNNNIVSLTLCVLSEICTPELSKELHNDVLKCIANNSAYIRKKAILCGIKVCKKAPEYISDFLPKISTCLQEKSHGVLLSCIAFLQNVLQLDESFANQLVDLVPKIGRAYRLVAQEHNAQYEISGVQDPFLQVAILKFLRSLRRLTPTFDKQLAEILVISHDTVCSRVSNNLKNGANAVLFQCFQCFMQLEPTAQLKEMVANVLSKFISVKDANSKYLSLFNLNLMTKYDLKIVKNHKATIFDCLNENDILIRIMALDLLYVIASPENVQDITKQLLSVLLAANDQQFIAELALKICLIVEKHSHSRRWHFDTILKVLVLADQAVKEESAKSLVYLVQSTPQLQEYCMTKLFFSATENFQNDALCKIVLYLIGEISEVLLKIKSVKITEANVLDLIENIIFKSGINNDTISYGLSALLKLYEKYSQKERIIKIIKTFEAHSDLQVQKRACQYTKLLDSTWDQDRKREICIPVPAFKTTADSFKMIPVGETDLDLDLQDQRMPERINVNYEEHLVKEEEKQEFHRQIIKEIKKEAKKEIVPPVQEVKKSLMDEDDIFNSIMNAPTQGPAQIPVIHEKQSQEDSNQNFFSGGFQAISFNEPPKVSPSTSDPFNILGLDMGKSPSSTGNQSNDFLLDLNSNFSQPTQPQYQSNSNNNQSLLGNYQDNSNQFNFNQFPNTNSNSFQSHPQPQNTFSNQTSVQNQNSFGFNLLGNQSAQSVSVEKKGNKFLAYENEQTQIWMDCQKESSDTTKIIASYVNKTGSHISEINMQAAVLKHIKLTINPLSSQTIDPFSKETVHQTLIVTNSQPGQKAVVMKMKLSYTWNGQKISVEEKIANFPSFV